MKLTKIVIKRFRSILELELKLDTSNNFISICGQNNTGKTNVFRAIRLFFRPELYTAELDSPYYKYFVTRGGAVYPSITLTFSNEDGYNYVITKEFDMEGLKEVSGYKILNGNTRNRNDLKEKDCIEILKKVKFFFIEAVNISLPELINDLTDDLFDVEYGHSVFRGAKAKLKTAFEEYTDGLNNILNNLSQDINPMFHNFRENWDVSFKLESDVKKFRDLISTDINFDILDGSHNSIDSKGAGLQRLAFILLHIRIIQKIQNHNVIFMIDEPDVFIHAGLQKKLCQYLKGLNNNVQVFVATHSKIFIDTYSLKNVFLLELNVSEIYSKRTKRHSKILRTVNVPLNEESGSKKIKDYLGIQNDNDDILQPYNVLVEGESDRKYLSELIKYFGFDLPNIIPLNGADNLPLYLKYYDSMYKEVDVSPKILILLDNDIKGREVARKVIKQIKNNDFKNIQCSFSFIPNFQGKIQDKNNLEHITTNNEIEDFMFPSIIVYLVNILLKKKGMKTIPERQICAKIKQNAFNYKGILELCENAKNEANPDIGNQLVFTSSGIATNNIKTSLAKLFNVESDIKLINLLEQANMKYPEVKKYVEKIATNTMNA